MKDWTGIEIERVHQGVEQAAALVLGRMLFEFSRLDVALGLCLVWSREGREIERLTREVEDLSFHKKLEFLEKLASAKIAENQESQALYAEWIRDANVTRQVRNELVHGRWGIEPTKGQVINVVGLPTSPEQKVTGYTIQDLKCQLEEMERLQQRLSSLRESYPL